MAVIDKLLATAAHRQMDCVVLEPGNPPRMVRTGVAHDVTRVPLDGATIARLVAEIAPGQQTPPGGEFCYQIGGVEFRFVSHGGGGWTARAATGDVVAHVAPANHGLDALETGAASAAESRPITAIDELLLLLLDQGGSDLHLTSGQPPCIRVHGDLCPVRKFQPPTADRLTQLLYEVTPPRNRNEFESTNDSDFAHEIPGRARFRVNLFRERSGAGAVFRQIPHRVPTADELGLSPAIRRLVDLSRGLVLVTGPTGSGKSTTLAAIIDLINETRTDHIITIEDPIEFVHCSKRCLVHQREVGSHTGSFKRALRAALREDPDVVLVGEMRDLETTAIAIETAETGHLVFGTLHTTTAASTVDRLVDQFPEGQQAQIRLMLSGSLRAVISQTLLKKIGGGRVAAQEVMICTPGIANMIREGKTFQIPSAMQTGRKLGMGLLNDALVKLVESKAVAPREAYLKAADKEDLLNRFRALGIDAEKVVAPS